MKNKHKIIFVKAIISLGGILLIITIILLALLKSSTPDNPNFHLYDAASLISFIILTIVGIIMLILMCKIDIRPERVPSTKYKIKVNNYNELKKELYEKLEIEGYNIFDTYQEKLYTVDYAIKEQFNSTYIIGLLNLTELTEEIFQKYKEACFEDFGNYLLEANQINRYKDFNVIYIICVGKVNSIFPKYTEGNIKQHFGRCLLPIGVSFASKTLYIATQKEGIAIVRYKRLKKLFLNYISDLIRNNKN